MALDLVKRIRVINEQGETVDAPIDYKSLANLPTFKTVNGQAITGTGNIVVAGGTGEGGGGAASVELDTTLTQSGKAADAKAVGDAVNAIPKQFKTINGETITGTGNIVVSGGQNSDLTFNRFISETIRQVTKVINFPMYSVSGNIAVIGDSTISGYPSYPALSSYLSVAAGYKITDISYPGDTLSGQLQKWNAIPSSDKSELNYVFSQIGLNDIDKPYETFRSNYEALIAQIRQDAPNAMLVLGTMLPCKQRMKDLWSSNWQFNYNVWKSANDDIKNGYYDCDRVAYLHTDALGFDDNLRSEYDHSDHIHINQNGGKVIVYSWCLTAFDNSSSVTGKNVVSISVTTPPNKTSYTEGDMFDTTGMVVTAKYSDNSNSVITEYEYSPMRALLTTDNTVTITYRGLTTSVPITVAELVVNLESLTVEGSPTKTQYYVGEEFSTDGLTFKAHYDDGSSMVIPNENITITPTFMRLEDTSVTASYTKGTITKEVVINGLTVIDMSTLSGDWLTNIVTEDPEKHSEFMSKYDLSDKLMKGYDVIFHTPEFQQIFEGKIIAQLSMGNLGAGNVVTLYSNPLGDSEPYTTDGRTVVGVITGTDDEGASGTSCKTYTVSSPLPIKVGETLSVSYSADIAAPKAGWLSGYDTPAKYKYPDSNAFATDLPKFSSFDLYIAE